MKRLFRYLGRALGSIPWHYTAWHVIAPVFAVWSVALVTGAVGMWPIFEPGTAVCVSIVAGIFLMLIMLVRALSKTDDYVNRGEKLELKIPKLWVYPAIMALAQLWALWTSDGTMNGIRLYVVAGVAVFLASVVWIGLFDRFRINNPLFDEEVNEWGRYLPLPHIVLGTMLAFIIAAAPAYFVGFCTLWYLDHPHTWVEFAQERQNGNILLAPTMGLGVMIMFVSALTIDLIVRKRPVPAKKESTEEMLIGNVA